MSTVGDVKKALGLTSEYLEFPSLKMGGFQYRVHVPTRKWEYLSIYSNTWIAYVDDLQGFLWEKVRELSKLPQYPHMKEVAALLQETGIEL